MLKHNRCFVLVILACLALLLAATACQAPTPTPAPKPAVPAAKPIPTPATIPVVPVPASVAEMLKSTTATPAKTLSDAGQKAFVACTACHGEKGQGNEFGPSVIGVGSNLSTAGTAQNLYAYMAAQMPKDHAGSLKPEEYLQVTAYLLLSNGLVKADDAISPAGLAQLKLKP